MELYQKLIKIIDCKKTIELQLEALSQFDNISKEEILVLAQTCHKRTEAGLLIEYLGFEKLKPYLPLFLEFLQDVNWPAARGAANMLLKAAEEIIPEIKRVFSEVKDDSMWHYWILQEIVKNFEPELIIELKLDLILLIKRADKDGAATEALLIVKQNNLLPEEDIEILYQYLLNEYNESKALTNELIEEIKAINKLKN